MQTFGRGIEAPELDHCGQRRELIRSESILIFVAHPPPSRHRE
jgi:hypothetical protein